MWMRIYFTVSLSLLFLVLSACDEKYQLKLPNQVPVVSMSTDTYCLLDEQVIFELTFNDYEENPLNFEMVVNQQVLDVANVYSTNQGVRSSQDGFTHYVAWQKACEAIDFAVGDDLPDWTKECPPACALRPDPQLNTDIDTCFSLPEDIPENLDMRVVVSDGDEQSEARFTLSYAGPCTSL